MKKAIALSLMAVIVISMLVSCGGNSIVGKWQAEIEGETAAYEFKSDGTLEMSGSGLTFSGTYSVKDDQLTITISFMGMENTDTNKFKIDGDTLTRYDEDGEATVLTRVK